MATPSATVTRSMDYIMATITKRGTHAYNNPMLTIVREGLEGMDWREGTEGREEGMEWREGIEGREEGMEWREGIEGKDGN